MRKDLKKVKKIKKDFLPEVNPLMQTQNIPKYH